ASQRGGRDPTTDLMATRLNELTREEVERVEQSRLRATRRAARRELATEVGVATAFLAAAAALRLGAGGPVRLGLAAGLIALHATLLHITFEVGEGRTHPLQLA